MREIRATRWVRFPGLASLAAIRAAACVGPWASLLKLQPAQLPSRLYVLAFGAMPGRCCFLRVTRRKHQTPGNAEEHKRQDHLQPTQSAQPTNPTDQAQSTTCPHTYTCICFTRCIASQRCRSICANCSVTYWKELLRRVIATMDLHACHVFRLDAVGLPR